MKDGLQRDEEEKTNGHTKPKTDAADNDSSDGAISDSDAENDTGT